MEQRVKLEVRDAIAYVTMTRGDKYNGLDHDMLRGLIGAAKTIRKDRSIRAVILQGEGKAFCAGLDFPSVMKHPFRFALGGFKFGRRTNFYQEVCWCWRKLPVPVIAVVHGRCYGGGLQIALAADFRFATPDCEFSIMEVKWGLIPDMTGTVTLRELLPMDQAMRLTMTGGIFTGNEAMTLNLVTGVSEDPLAAAQALAAQISGRSPDAVAAAKRLFHRTWTASERKAFAIETLTQVRLFIGRNQRIALRANFAKKAPAFEDRRFDS